MKKCKKCDIEKYLDDFYKDKNSKDEHRSSCKECDKKYNDENKNKRRENSKKYAKTEKRKQYNLKYKEENKDIISKKRKIRYEENREVELLQQKEYREDKREIINERERNRYHSIGDKKTFNKIKNDKRKEYRKKYYEKNKKDILEQRKKYYEENIDSIKKYKEEYKPTRRLKRKVSYEYKIKNDKLFYLNESIRSLIKQTFKKKNFRKKSRTLEILGCTCEEFKIHLESKFEEWMNWDNRGLYNGEMMYGWDIDHIIPISTAETEEDLIRLNHFTNLQPLCSYINRVLKKDKIDF